MVDNAPVKQLRCDRITVEGYSRAAVQSYWRIPELKIGFDLGAQPWDFMGTPTWLVTHPHLDHLAALPVYIARRRMMRMEPPVIYLPESCVEWVDRLLKCVRHLDRGRLPCELRGVRAGDELEISRELVATVGATAHTVPSVCYTIWERRRKLKSEFAHLAGDQIRDLRLSGVDVTQEVRVPLVAYLGDSAPRGLDDNPCLYEAKVLIAEMTFVAPSHRKEKIHKHGHMHLDDFVERRERFKNEWIIASHFSTRYHKNHIRQLVERALPDLLGGRMHLWL